jgi:glutathione peroxidase
MMVVAMNFFDFSIPMPDGSRKSLAEFRGRYVLAVNTASKCGFTPQYEGLQKLQQELSDDKLVIIGFPCNQFNGQEPGSDVEIAEFCSANFDISFPLSAKVNVNGPDAEPLWAWLAAEKPGLLGSRSIKWNFTKFLVSPTGEVLARFGSMETPAVIAHFLDSHTRRVAS